MKLSQQQIPAVNVSHTFNHIKFQHPQEVISPASSHSSTPEFNKFSLESTLVSDSKIQSSVQDTVNENSQKRILEFTSAAAATSGTTSSDIFRHSNQGEYWECSQCTFVNKVKVWSKTRLKCEVCLFTPTELPKFQLKSC